MKSRKTNQKNHDNESKRRINQEIKVPEVRLIDADNTQLGIRTRTEALRMAELKNLDLVEIAPNAKPPVCKLIDYGKFLYELQKKEKNQKKNQTQQSLKEIRFKWRTADHDFNFKIKHARAFIEEGSKVKAMVVFRGRELAHTNIGKDLLMKFIEVMSDVAKIDQPLNDEGRSISVILSPLKTKASGSKPAKPKEQKDTKSKETPKENIEQVEEK